MDVLQDLGSTAVANSSSSLIAPIMQFFSSAILLGSVALQSAFARPNLSQPGSTQGQILRQSVEDFIQSESSIALEQLLCNIGADGCHASGVNYGLVIASPSREEPPCMYNP